MQRRSESTSFKSCKQFNNMVDPAIAGSRKSIGRSVAQRYFSGDALQDKLARALARELALPIKELVESCEFFACVRQRVRARVVADLCCGHGLVGILFALFERQVEEVVLIDREQPDNFAKVLDSAVRVGPWVGDKVVYREAPLKNVPGLLEPGTSIVATHACGALTDHCLDCAVQVGGAVAVMPCCYPRRICPAPQALQRQFGMEQAFDIHRTYRLEEAGYYVRWTSVPEVITPMHRVLIGTPRR